MKCMGILGLVVSLVGSIFAAYDNFPILNTLNNRYIPVCKQWDNILGKIEPYTANSRMPIEKMQPFYTVERKNKEFDILLSIIISNNNIVPPNADKIIVSVSQINNGTRSGGSVILANDHQQWSVSTPDMLMQWIKDFRKTWFLKWGLILITIGTFIRIIKEIFLCKFSDTHRSSN